MKVSVVKTFGTTLALAALLALSSLMLVACGGDSNAAKDSNSTPSSESTKNKSDSKKNESNSDASNALSELEGSLSEAYMGVTETGEGFYYASSATGDLCLIAVLNENAESVSFAGPATSSGNMVTVTDNESSSSLTFEILPQNDGTIMLDMGDLGTALIAPCKVSEVLEAMSVIDTYSTAVL